MANGTAVQFDPNADYAPAQSGAPTFDPSADYAPAAAPAPQPGSPAPTSVPAAPSLGERIWDTLPGIGTTHALSGEVQRYLESKEPLKNPQAISNESPTEAAIRQGITGSLADVAGLVHGATSPLGAATTAATIAAPEVMGPVLAAHGAYTGATGWGDLRNPDVLQNELNSAAEVAGGLATTGQGIKTGGAVRQGVKSAMAAKAAAQAPEANFGNFSKAIPSKASTPYERADYDAARPYLENEHTANSIDTVKGTRDAADAAIGKIEDAVAERIQKTPNLQIQTDPLDAVQKRLASNPRGQSFVDAGLKELDDFNLDQPKTVAEADAIRRQLNAENQAVLQKNNYKIATARATDPGFAAREAAAESLRDGIYGQFPDLRHLRLDEGSLIKVRNAAQAQAENGTNRVGGTAPVSLPARMLRRGATLAGASLGYGAMGPAGGAMGAEAGGAVAEAMSPKNLTRDQLAAKSFERPVTNGATRLEQVRANTRLYPNAISGTQPPLPMQQGPLFQTPLPQSGNLPGGPQAFNQARAPQFSAGPYGADARQITMNQGGQQQGYLLYDIDPKGSASVDSSLLTDAMQGKGHGIEMYRRAIADAKNAGAKEFTSGSAPEPGAVGVWKALSREFPVKKTGSTYSIDLTEPEPALK